MPIETDRLLLRRLTADDAPAIHALDNDPEVMRYINGGVPTPLEVIETTLLPNLMRHDPARPHFGCFAVCALESSAFLGWVSLRPTAADPREAELGYRFGRDAWGHGYATEAARALVARAFAGGATDRVIANTYEDNLASQRVMDRLGLTLRRRFRPTPEQLATSDTAHRPDLTSWDGDDLEYAIAREDWPAAPSV
ncbi:MAG: GNAT family N-acetyltransferase [Chloroflexi bacterium]|nr:GNAT family N-acetyltransferase [Chloroflexota bacterium]MDA1145412.1 GNAT family N-acetyltransferase [Chloroflexota bacterium]